MKKRTNVSKRHDALRELLQNTQVHDQQTLVELMKERYNISTNQSIISRDLRSLGVSKRVAGQSTVYELPSVDASQEILQLCIVSVERSDHLVVVKTVAGLASFVGDFLDAQKNLPILGTIAGENTIFVAPQLGVTAQSCLEEVAKVLHSKSKLES